jgi:hypothetical protein
MNSLSINDFIGYVDKASNFLIETDLCRILLNIKYKKRIRLHLVYINLLYYIDKV